MHTLHPQQLSAMIFNRHNLVSLAAAMAILVATLYCACFGESAAPTRAMAMHSCCAPASNCHRPGAPHKTPSGCSHCAGGIAFERGEAGILAATGWQGPVLIAATPRENGISIRGACPSLRVGREEAAGGGNHSLLSMHCALRI